MSQNTEAKKATSVLPTIPVHSPGESQAALEAIRYYQCLEAVELLESRWEHHTRSDLDLVKSLDIRDVRDAFLMEIKFAWYWIPEIEYRLAPEVKEWEDWMGEEDGELY